MSMELKIKMQNLIDAANTTTGKTDETLTDAVQTLVDGYGGINAEMFGGTIRRNVEALETPITVPDNAGAKLPRPINTSSLGVLDMEALEALTDAQRYFAAGDELTGLIYSSNHWDGKDVLWNRSLKTYYSAIRNPASVMYIENVQVPAFSSSRGAYFGGVCSSAAAYLTGAKYPYTTNEMVLTGSPFRKVVHDASSAETDVTKSACVDRVAEGDLLVLDDAGHVKIVSKIEEDISGNVLELEISEETNPCYKTTRYSAADFKTSVLNKYSVFKYKNRTEGLEARARAVTRQPTIQDKSGISFYYGNDTYITIQEATDPDVEIRKKITRTWIPEGTTLYDCYKQADGSWSEERSYHLKQSSSDAETGLTPVYSNECRCYTLRTYFTHTGEYKFRLDDKTDCCIIKVIDTGDITVTPISGEQKKFTLALSGYEQCKPVWFTLTKLEAVSDTVHRTSRDEYIQHIPAGYHGVTEHLSYVDIDLNADGEQTIDVSRIVNTSSHTYVGFMLRVMYDTGYGLALAQSDAILFDN